MLDCFLVKTTSCLPSCSQSISCNKNTDISCPCIDTTLVHKKIIQHCIWMLFFLPTLPINLTAIHFDCGKQHIEFAAFNGDRRKSDTHLDWLHCLRMGLDAVTTTTLWAKYKVYWDTCCQVQLMVVWPYLAYTTLPIPVSELQTAKVAQIRALYVKFHKTKRNLHVAYSEMLKL